MAKTCKNPDCDSRPWWGGWCRLCWQVTGVGDQAAADRRQREQDEREAKLEAERQRARDRLLELTPDAYVGNAPEQARAFKRDR